MATAKYILIRKNTWMSRNSYIDEAYAAICRYFNNDAG